MITKNNIFTSLVILYGTGCSISFDSHGLTEDSVSTTTATIATETNPNTTESESTNFTPTTSNASTTDSLLTLTSETSENSTGNNVTSFTTSDSTSDFTTSESENQTSTGDEISICGNLIVEGYEECDKGAGDETCTHDCKLSFCGDGHINLAANEECEDKNLIDDDDCSNDCVKPRWIFLTSDYIGPPTFGGVAKADEFCQNDANKFGYPGIFRAWLSDSDFMHDPAIRFGDFETWEGWYKLPSNPPKPVAKGWHIQEGILTPIDTMLNGLQDLSAESVWTNTWPDGKAIDYASNCNNWTSNGSFITYIGSPHTIFPHYWTNIGQKNCSSGVGSKLYCFETNK
jgi:cysteine-rich repeat protein